MRAVLFSCAVLMSHVVFMATVAFGAPCPERCPDDGPDGRCPPACVACSCSPRPAPSAFPADVAAPPARGEPVPAFVTPAPREAEPSDIFHVPKHLLV
jgi:hypothetical protein